MFYIEFLTEICYKLNDTLVFSDNDDLVIINSNVNITSRAMLALELHTKSGWGRIRPMYLSLLVKI